MKYIEEMVLNYTIKILDKLMDQNLYSDASHLLTKFIDFKISEKDNKTI